MKFRKKADNYDELDDLIKKKKIEMQQKLQAMGNKMDNDLDDDSDDDIDKISPDKEI